MAIRSVKDKKDKEAKQQVKKIFMEFFLHFLFTVIRYGTQIAFFIDALNFKMKLNVSLPERSQKQQINVTKSVGYCTNKIWKPDDIASKIKHFQGMTYIFGFFVAGSILIVLIQLSMWVLFLIRTSKDSKYPETIGTRMGNLIRYKFGFIENLVHDMPLSVMAIVVFVTRSGTNGLTCLLCAVDYQCIEAKQLKNSLSSSATVLALSLCIISITVMWRGLNVFFRWSYTKECSMVPLRGCASIFFGIIYSLLILTPALLVINYQLFALPGIAGKMAAISGLIDKLIILGIIAWVLVIIGACCCPLIRAIS